MSAGCWLYYVFGAKEARLAERLDAIGWDVPGLPTLEAADGYFYADSSLTLRWMSTTMDRTVSAICTRALKGISLSAWSSITMLVTASGVTSLPAIINVTMPRSTVPWKVAVWAIRATTLRSGFAMFMSVISSVFVATRKRWNESRGSGK